MEMTGRYIINSPRQLVWEAMNDPQILKQAIPRCDEAIRHSDTEFTAVFSFNLGFIKPRLQSLISLSEIDAPNSYVMAAEGKGKLAGLAKGKARVKLSEQDATTTLLEFQAEGDMQGTIAEMASKLVTKTAQKLADDFFYRFDQVVSENKKL
ncbi:carbon monoxide dehydrogenase subunit G [Kiloniella laminariae]|uniref:Carbon monoxide dehydrogenase subunit G n=1 Tax=Kiloniella laminariae TaxID=454162 RepID=A0ABT4LNT3_9PROT|nr:carbon monoxide dehydrogenase subunit G [Kiloniella laminariae]MCZ4282711.1 carbon monoxide dehydrogenase subunit G [Kiloniella laminariae]